jgi:hypothetical protein
VGLEVPLPYRRATTTSREVGQLLNGLRRLLKEDSRERFLASIDGTLRSAEDAQAVLNACAHASDSGASAGEVRSTLNAFATSTRVVVNATRASERELAALARSVAASSEPRREVITPDPIGPSGC